MYRRRKKIVDFVVVFCIPCIETPYIIRWRSMKPQFLEYVQQNISILSNRRKRNHRSPAKVVHIWGIVEKTLQHLYLWIEYQVQQHRLLHHFVEIAVRRVTVFLCVFLVNQNIISFMSSVVNNYREEKTIDAIDPPHIVQMVEISSLNVVCVSRSCSDKNRNLLLFVSSLPKIIFISFCYVKKLYK